MFVYVCLCLITFDYVRLHSTASDNRDTAALHIGNYAATVITNIKFHVVPPFMYGLNSVYHNSVLLQDNGGKLTIR